MRFKDAVTVCAEELKLRFLLELKTETWGQQHFIVQDPMGIGIDLVRQLEASSN